MLAYKTVSGTKNFKKLTHLVLQFVAFILGATGFWAALKFHNDKGIDNFYSLHSWLGLACLFLLSKTSAHSFPPATITDIFALAGLVTHRYLVSPSQITKIYSLLVCQSPWKRGMPWTTSTTSPCW